MKILIGRLDDCINGTAEFVNFDVKNSQDFYELKPRIKYMHESDYLLCIEYVKRRRYYCCHNGESLWKCLYRFVTNQAICFGIDNVFDFEN